VWLEGTSLGDLMRTSGVWAYGVVNLAHILGIATLFGGVLVLDLRLLGLWSQVPLSALEKPAVALASCGFVLAIASGVSLITTNATEYLGNPFLVVKFTAIGLGLVNVIAAQKLPAWRQRAVVPLTPRARATLAAIGATSLACWVTAIAAGRMVGYW